MSSSGPWVSGLGLEEVIRQLPVAVMVVQAGLFRVVECNDRARDMTERQLARSVPDVVEDDWEIFRPDGRRYAMEEWPLIRSLTSGEEVVGEQYFNLLDDGSRMIVRSSSSPIYDDHGEIVAGVLVMEDITAQRQVEEQIAHHGSLLENVEDAVVSVDPDWLITGWNQGAERIYGWSAEDVLGQHVPTFVRMDLSDQRRADMRRQIAERGRSRFEATVERKDGSMVAVEVINVAIRNRQGEVSGYLGIHRDITERRAAEQALREANRRSETILESITDAFVAVDQDWRYTYANARALARMSARKGTTLALEDVLGRSMWVLFPEALGTDAHRRYQQTMRDRRPVAFETYLPDLGEWIEVHLYPSDSGLSIYYRDISASRHAEKELRQARELERTRIARALHDDALQSLTEAMVLARTEGSTSSGSRPSSDLASVLRRAGEQLRGAIYDLRLGTEAHRPFPELVAELVEVHREMADNYQVSLEWGDGAPTGSLGDPGLEVLRILGEALTNVRRHAEARQARVRVWGAEDVVWAEVSDDGRGFDTASPVSHAHLGIVGMRERAELLNGHLVIHSEPGAGTTLRLDVIINQGTRTDISASR